MKKIALTVGIITITISTVLAVHAIVTKPQPTHAILAPQQSEQAALPQTKQVADAFSTMAEPKTLVIPGLNIESPILPVGLTQDGAMEIPDSLTDTGWYKQGVAPGNPGKAVLAAHTGYPNKPTAFRNLERLSVGAAIDVRDTNGMSAHFEVIQIARYPTEAAPRDHIFGDSPTARLNIITCAGTWDAAHNTYSERLVVYAVRTK